MIKPTDPPILTTTKVALIALGVYLLTDLLRFALAPRHDGPWYAPPSAFTDDPTPAEQFTPAEPYQEKPKSRGGDLYGPTYYDNGPATK